MNIGRSGDILLKSFYKRVIKILKTMKLKWLKEIPSTCLKGFVEYKIVRHLKPLPPSIFHFPVTYRCNSKCKMCGIWKKKERSELSLKEIENMLTDPIFENIKYCGLGGGEPTLRGDLPKIVKLIIYRCKKLKSIGFSTNGLVPSLVLRQSETIAEICEKKNITFDITVSLDGLGKAHDTIRGIPGAFERTFETLKRLIELKSQKKIGVGINYVITKWNVDGIFEFYKWFKNNKIPYDFALALVQRRLCNENFDFVITDSQLPTVKKFFEILRKEYPFNYQYFIQNQILFGKHRKLICPFIVEGFSIDPNGDVYFCPNSKPIGNIFQKDISSIYYNSQNLNYRRFIEKRICPHCFQNCFWSVSFYKSLDIAIPFFLFSFLKYKLFSK